MPKWAVRLIGQRRRSFKKYFFTGLSVVGLTAATVDGATSGSENAIATAKGLLVFLRSTNVGLSISLDYYISTLGLTEGTPNYGVMMGRVHQRGANRIRDGCLRNGGIYVKMGQGLVSLSHILPREYIDTLKVLQDKCLVRDTEELYEVFREDFGQSPEELFQTFETKPIAAASIAQVFKATTKEGQSVAVKVQYNDLQKRMQSDVRTINVLLKIGAFLHPKVDFTWILDDFVDALKQELDFVNEARNSERCARDLGHLKYVRVPKVLWKYTNTRVLVTEFVEAIKISDFDALHKAGFSLRDVNYKLFESFGYQIFQSGFVHADPHPGNVMVRRNERGQTELVLLDHGLYQQISQEERISLGHLWKAIVLRDHTKMRYYSKSMGVDDHVMLAEILTQAPLKSTGFRLKIKPTKEEEAHMRKFASERFDLIVNCLRQMPRSLLLVVRNLNTIRAISYDLGSPVDRYAVLARIATKAAFEDEQKSTHKMLVLPQKLWFEVKLLITQLANYWRTLFLHVMYKLGLTPNINAIIESATKEANQFV